MADLLKELPSDTELLDWLQREWDTVEWRLVNDDQLRERSLEIGVRRPAYPESFPGDGDDNFRVIVARLLHAEVPPQFVVRPRSPLPPA